MRFLSLAAAFLLAAPALADDRAECRSGIEMIQAEIAKAPAPETLAKLRDALRSAEREEREGELDECLEAVDDAKAALGRG